MASPDPLALPSADLVANKYRLTRLIGRGGMGSVWEGIHVTLGNRVAVKFIESDYAESDEARTRFENEARAAAKLQSKHVVQVFDYGVMPDGRPFIVMEYLAGESLDARLEKVGRLDAEETTRIITQVSRALAKAHAAGIVHRDLKPENVFLVRDDDEASDLAKVVDFGIAKFTDMSMGVSSSTRTGSVLGTPYYMSPEQARGLRTVDYRSDLWSLAVITFRCFTGRYPFEGEAIGDLLVKICTAPLPTPSQIAPVPPGFDAWFERAMQRDPALRFSSANEFAEQLAICCGIKGVRPPQPSTSREVPNYEGGAQARTGIDDTSMPISRTLGHTKSARRSGLALAAASAAIFLAGSAGGVWYVLSHKSGAEHAASAAPSTTAPTVAPSAQVSAVAVAPSASAQPSAVVERQVVPAASVSPSAVQPAVPPVARPQAAARQPAQPRPAKSNGGANAPSPPAPQHAGRPADILGY